MYVTRHGQLVQIVCNKPLLLSEKHEKLDFLYVVKFQHLKVLFHYGICVQVHIEFIFTFLFISDEELIH